nr:uncharacterized protein LOC112426765 [Macaca nemestrina]
MTYPHLSAIPVEYEHSVGMTLTLSALPSKTRALSILLALKQSAVTQDNGKENVPARGCSAIWAAGWARGSRPQLLGRGAGGRGAAKGRHLVGKECRNAPRRLNERHFHTQGGGGRGTWERRTRSKASLVTARPEGSPFSQSAFQRPTPLQAPRAPFAVERGVPGCRTLRDESMKEKIHTLESIGPTPLIQNNSIKNDTHHIGMSTVKATSHEKNYDKVYFLALCQALRSEYMDRSLDSAGVSAARAEPNRQNVCRA